MTYTPRKKRRKRLDPEKPGADYRQLWRVIDGAVADAFKMHPGYLAHAEKDVRRSLVKRVTGAVLAHQRDSSASHRLAQEARSGDVSAGGLT